MLTFKNDQSASVAGQHTAFQSSGQDVVFSMKFPRTLVESH